MLTVIFSSYNGEATLPPMLDAMATLSVPPGGWKLVAVDNGSTDGTRAILESYRSRLPLEILEQKKPGKNAALNAGVDNREGDLTVLTDDDVIPEPDWLCALYDGAQRYPDFSVFGGSISPVWPSPPPEWILRHVDLAVAYAKTGSDWPEGAITPKKIWGPNMMVRSSIFDLGYRFKEDVGPNAGMSQYVMGGETEFTKRLAFAGYRCCHIPCAHVGHLVRPEQLQRRWLLQRAEKFGRSFAATADGGCTGSVPQLFGAPRWMLRALITLYVQALKKGATFRTNASFEALWRFKVLKGHWSQIRKQSAVTRGK